MITVRIVAAFLVASFSLLGHSPLIGQEPVVSSIDTIPQVAGSWLLTSRGGAGPYTLTFVQTGSNLRADFSADVQCDQTSVRMYITLEGSVHGRDVRLRLTKGTIASGRIDSEQADRCSDYQLLTSTVQFRGILSLDGKTIMGPYDDTGDPTHVWRFRRNR